WRARRCCWLARWSGAAPHEGISGPIKGIHWINDPECFRIRALIIIPTTTLARSSAVTPAGETSHGDVKS
ncbi:hypothetical protein, partial [Mixta calida]|uniref:hypothetical protein n=1 Tax=Mixta calida TaxID=665913 RepID=UPI0034D3EBE9